MTGKVKLLKTMNGIKSWNYHYSFPKKVGIAEYKHNPQNAIEGTVFIRLLIKKVLVYHLIQIQSYNIQVVLKRTKQIQV